MIAEENDQQREELVGYLSSQRGITVVSAVQDGEKASVLAQHLQLDVMIFDLLLPRLDGFTLLEQLQLIPDEDRPRVIILTASRQAELLLRAETMGAAHCLQKPADLPRLAALVRQLGARTAPSPASARADAVPADILERYVRQVLIRLGISPHLKGHRFLQRAIILVNDAPDLLDHMLSDLYPAIAREFGTTASCVERSIRFALSRAWENGGAIAFNKLLGRAPDLYLDKPSNREFIALLTERIRIRRQE